jgi:peptidoglycan-associated lipoprotein
MRPCEPILLQRHILTSRTITGRITSGLLLALVVVSVVLMSGCPKDKPVAKAPPTAPLPPTPTASISVTPATVQAGQQITLTWSTENATDVAIAQLGAVQPSGSQTLIPTESTTYQLTAKGPGGVQESDARVTVVAAAAQTAPTEENIPAESANRLDVFFDTDDYAIRSDQIATIKTDAQFLKEHSDLSIVVEGHCDEMGSTEYNLALGDRRASEVKIALEKAGVSAVRIRTISYGKEQPFCTDQTEDCWKLNRRAHVAPDLQR